MFGNGDAEYSFSLLHCLRDDSCDVPKPDCTPISGGFYSEDEVFLEGLFVYFCFSLFM